MDSANIKDPAKIKKWVPWYNQIPNVFWSLLNFIVIGYFCFMFMHLKWLFIILALSLLAGFLPNTFFDKIQLSQTTSLYKKIGIRIVKTYTQDGDLINRIIRKKFPGYRVFDNNSSIPRHINRAYSVEKIHFIMFLFFLLTSIYALTKGYEWWAVIITVNNLIFNIYPILLQQYNRLRFKHLSIKLSLKQYPRP